MEANMNVSTFDFAFLNNHDKNNSHEHLLSCYLYIYGLVQFR